MDPASFPSWGSVICLCAATLTGGHRGLLNAETDNLCFVIVQVNIPLWALVHLPVVVTITTAVFTPKGWLHCILYVLFENAMGIVKLWAVIAGALPFSSSCSPCHHLSVCRSWLDHKPLLHHSCRSRGHRCLAVAQVLQRPAAVDGTLLQSRASRSASVLLY